MNTRDSGVARKANRAKNEFKDLILGYKGSNGAKYKYHKDSPLKHYKTTPFGGRRYYTPRTKPGGHMSSYGDAAKFYGYGKKAIQKYQKRKKQKKQQK